MACEGLDCLRRKALFDPGTHGEMLQRMPVKTSWRRSVRFRVAFMSLGKSYEQD
jgi:hypothetical protein